MLIAFILRRRGPLRQWRNRIGCAPAGIGRSETTMRIMPPLYIAALLCALPVAGWAAGQPALYPSEAAAKQACPNDIVVWLNTKSGMYHYKGQKWYGATTVGAYVCKAEADGAGDTPGDLPIPGQQ
jgi:hypothetical protein